MKSCLALLIIFCFAIPLYPQTIIKTPQEASGGLFQAWRKQQRKTAQKFARAEAVDKLFGTRWRAMKFKGCMKREENEGGGYECIYEDAKIDLTIAMIVKNFRVGYKVTELSFSSEAI